MIALERSSGCLRRTRRSSVSEQVELARLREKPIARDLGISDSCLGGWMNRADIDEGNKEGVTSDDRIELVRLRREVRVKEMEIEILKRASAYNA